MRRFFTIACAGLFLTSITYAQAKKSAPPAHASPAAAIELLRQRNILKRDDRVISVKWSVDSWHITQRSRKGTVVTWAVDAKAQKFEFLSGHTKAGVGAAIFHPVPRIPDEARRKRLRGTGLFVSHVRPDGTVSRVETRRSTGHVILDQACLEAFLKWRFLPGAAPKINIPIDFTGNY